MQTHHSKNKIPVSDNDNQNNKLQSVHFKDNRPESTTQLKVQQMANNAVVDAPIQRRTNNTGMPDNLKSGIEKLSGLDMSDVKVHYNSNQPAQFRAHAFAQGNQIHLASGQEKHLPHEAWHVVQQKQGRVKSTMQMRGTINVNDDVVLEKEADVMGNKALQMMYTSDQSESKVEVTNFGYSRNKRNVSTYLTKSRDNQKIIQRLRKKMRVSRAVYRKRLRSTVYLWSEFVSNLTGATTKLGLFQTSSTSHAEENLIQRINNLNLRDGTLTIHLSTSPCSSSPSHRTRCDGKTGCQERLNGLKSARNIKVEVLADHLYQPKIVAAKERKAKKGVGDTSNRGATKARFRIRFSRLPKAFHSHKRITNEDVAQFKTIEQVPDDSLKLLGIEEIYIHEEKGERIIEVQGDFDKEQIDGIDAESSE